MKSKSAIVVDDDFEITEVFSELLQIHGITVMGVGYNGVDAIELFKKHSPDMVFLDVHMPKLNGLEALVKIKKLSSESKVIMITSDLSVDLEKQLQHIGANAIVYKPFDIQKIIQITENIYKSSNMLIQ